MSQLFSVRGLAEGSECEGKEMRWEEQQQQQRQSEIRGDREAKRLLVQSSWNKGSKVSLRHGTETSTQLATDPGSAQSF